MALLFLFQLVMPGNFSHCYLSVVHVWWFAHVTRIQLGETAGGSTFFCLVRMTRDSPHSQWQWHGHRPWGKHPASPFAFCFSFPLSTATKYMHVVQPVPASSGMLLSISQYFSIFLLPYVVKCSLTLLSWTRQGPAFRWLPPFSGLLAMWRSCSERVSYVPAVFLEILHLPFIQITSVTVKTDWVGMGMAALKDLRPMPDFLWRSCSSTSQKTNRRVQRLCTPPTQL